MIKRMTICLFLFLNTYNLFAQGNFYDGKYAIEAGVAVSSNPNIRATTSTSVGFNFKHLTVGISYADNGEESGGGLGISYSNKKPEKKFYPSFGFSFATGENRYNSKKVNAFGLGIFANYRFVENENFLFETYIGFIGVMLGTTNDIGTPFVGNYPIGLNFGIPIQNLIISSNISVNFGGEFSSTSVGISIGYKF